jgi:hypothetical protein
MFLTGSANNAVIGGMPIPQRGTLNNIFAWGPELSPGQNNITVSGFTGLIRFEFIPKYIWGME